MSKIGAGKFPGGRPLKTIVPPRPGLLMVMFLCMVGWMG